MPSKPVAQAGERLDRDVRDAEEHAGGGAEQHSVVMIGGADARAREQEEAEGQQAGLERDHPAQRERRVRAGVGRQRDDEEEQAERGEPHPDPLAATDLEAEDPVGHDGHDHDARGEDGLHDRQRREDEGRHVQQPRAQGDGHADREPLGLEQRLAAAQGVGDVDGGRRVGATMLVEEGQLREDGTREGQQDA
jgi:hypothetical protein